MTGWDCLLTNDEILFGTQEALSLNKSDFEENLSKDWRILPDDTTAKAPIQADAARFIIKYGWSKKPVDTAKNAVNPIRH